MFYSKTRLIYADSTGNNETPLKYTGGMVLAVPVDAELFNLTDELVITKSFLLNDIIMR